MTPEPLHIIKANIHDGRIRDAYNYMVFRSLFKVHPVWLSNIIRKLNPYPPYIEVETSTKCNLRCVQCENTYWQEPPQDLTCLLYTSDAADE